MGKFCFWPGQREKLFFSFSSFFAFKQTKEQILFQTKPLQMLNKIKIKTFLCNNQHILRPWAKLFDKI